MKEKQGYQIGKNNISTDEGFTVAQQLEQQRVYEPIKGNHEQYKETRKTVSIA